MAVEIRVFPAIDAVLQISGTVLALEVKLFLLLAKQTLDSARHAFGDDFADYPMASASITRSRREARFLTAKIERIPEAANTLGSLRGRCALGGPVPDVHATRRAATGR